MFFLHYCIIMIIWKQYNSCLIYFIASLIDWERYDERARLSLNLTVAPTGRRIMRLMPARDVGRFPALRVLAGRRHSGSIALETNQTTPLV